jgi:hypothetical protein
MALSDVFIRQVKHGGKPLATRPRRRQDPLCLSMGLPIQRLGRGAAHRRVRLPNRSRLLGGLAGYAGYKATNQCQRKHCKTFLATFAWTNRNLMSLEVDILDAQLRALHQARPRPNGLDV